MRKGIEKTKEKIKSLRGKYKDLLDSSDPIEREFNEKSKYIEFRFAGYNVQISSVYKDKIRIPNL